MTFNKRKLTVNEVFAKLKVTDFRAFDKPGKNKGARGQLLNHLLKSDSNITEVTILSSTK